jgi:phosphatidylglycerophosphate synthase
MWHIKQKRNFNIADWFSIYRIIAVPFLILLVFLDKPTTFAIFLLISLSTDMIDGFLARKLRLVSERGAQLDSVGDALTFVVGLAGVTYFHWSFIQDNSQLIIAVFTLYLIQLGLAFWYYGAPSSFHTYLAKVSALFQGLFMVHLFFMEPQMWLFYTVITLGFIETLEEIILIFILPEWESDVKGLWWVLRRKKNIK